LLGLGNHRGIRNWKKKFYRVNCSVNKGWGGAVEISLDYSPTGISSVDLEIRGATSLLNRHMVSMGFREGLASLVHGGTVRIVEAVDYHLAVLHERQVYIPPNLHEVHVEHLERWGHQGEVDQLQNGPHLKVGLEGRDQLVVQLLECLLVALALGLAQEHIETRDGNQREDGLREK